MTREESHLTSFNGSGGQRASATNLTYVPLKPNRALWGR